MIRAWKFHRNGTEAFCYDLERGDHALVWVDPNWSHVVDEWEDAINIWGEEGDWHALENDRAMMGLTDTWSKEVDGITLHACVLSVGHNWNPTEADPQLRFNSVHDVVEELSDKHRISRPLKILVPGMRPGPKHMWNVAVTYGFVNAIARSYTETELYVPC